jgi:pimeloyl-ACP methyl ester carboxylesterase
MEKNISFHSGEYRLAGTICLPDSSEPVGAVLLVAGSGQIDRDENNRKLQTNILKQLAAYLASRKIGTLRFDKRGVGESEGDYWRTGFFDHVQDASAALEYLRSLPQVARKPVFLLGHSEGALICTRLAAEAQGPAGAILLAGAAETGETVLQWQLGEVTRNMGGINGFLIRNLHLNVRQAQEKALDKIKASPKDWFRQGWVKKINAKWMREFMAYDPSKDLRRIQVPILALTGSKDIQVNPDDLRLMQELVRTSIEVHEIPDMTHMLRTDDGDPSLSHYKGQVKRPLDPRLLQYIGDWLDKNTASRTERGVPLKAGKQAQGRVRV